MLPLCKYVSKNVKKEVGKSKRARLLFSFLDPTCIVAAFIYVYLRTIRLQIGFFFLLSSDFSFFFPQWR